MSLDQNIRYREPISNDNFNRQGLFDFVLPSRIIVLPNDPLITDGQQFWYAINNVTGTFWFKDNSGWVQLPFTFNVGGISGITGIVNEGAGAGHVFDQIIASTAYLRTIDSTTGKITIVTNAQTIDLGVNINKSDVGLSLVQNILSNLNSNRDPTTTDDVSVNYSIGSTWNNTSGAQSRFFVCKSNSINAAVWTLVGPSTGTTSLQNVGTGSHVYIDATNNPSQIRTLRSQAGKITFDTVSDPLTVNFGTNLSPGDVQLNLVQNILNNYVATTDPTNIDDSTRNYSNGSIWFNRATSNVGMFVCQSNAIGSAIWTNINGPGDVASFGCATTFNTLLSVQGTPIPLNFPFAFNGPPFSRGSWSSAINGVIQRASASNLRIPYLYNVQCRLEFPTSTVDYALVRFDMNPLSSNVSFAGSFTSSATMSLCGTFNGTYEGQVTITTLMSISDNNPAQFGVTAAITNASNVTVTNRNTQITIIQI
jgi:hypothetical protein